MNQQRNNYSAEFKTKVALAALKGDKTINEIASLHGVHPNQVMSWKRQAVEIMPDAFSGKRARVEKDDEELKAQLYQPNRPTESRVGLVEKKAALFS